MSAAPEPREAAHQDGGGFGKFQKRPFRRSTRTTPYDRPPTLIRNPTHGGGNNNNNNGWLSRIVDPAQRLITSSAHRLFAPFFRKRLPPPPCSQTAEPPVANGGLTERQQEVVSTDPTGTWGATFNKCDTPNKGTERGGAVTELELILKQKTFTRSEIDRLTTLLQSKIVDLPVGDEDKKSEVTPSKPVLSQDKREELPNNVVKIDEIDNHPVTTPIVSSSVLDEDVASPAELAKAYMGRRPTKVSPSFLGLHSQPLRENSTPRINRPFVSKSPIMAVVPRTSGHTGFPENRFVVPRSRGRSAIYSMARTPYSRAQSTTTVQDAGTAIDSYGGPSSSSQSPWGNNRFSGSTQVALKRRSSVMDDDIGSVGPIRRIRQKSNLLSASGTHAIRGTSFSSDTAQHTSLTQKTALMGKASVENGDDSVRGSGFTPVPSKSCEMASKILQQLDVLVSSREKSPTKLSPSMLSGPALRSMENIDSSKFLENVLNDNKLDVKHDNSRASMSQKQYKAEENGPAEFIASYDKSASAVKGVDTRSLMRSNVPNVETTAFPVNSVSQSPPQKKRAFQMSAHEDYLELDDNDYSNGPPYANLDEGREKVDAASAGKHSSATDSIMLQKPPASSAVNPSLSQKMVGTSDGPPVSTGITSNQALVDVQSTVLSNKTASLKDSYSVPPMFSFGEKAVLPKETNGPSPTTNFSCKTADKVPQVTFASSSSVVNEFRASSEPELESSSSLASAAVDATNSKKEPEPDKADDKNSLKTGVFFRSSETASAVVSTSSPTANTISFGIPTNSSCLNNGSLDSTPCSFSSPSPPPFSRNITGQNSSRSSTNTAANSCSIASAFSITTACTATGSSSSVSALVPSFSATPIFKFASSVVPSTSASSVLATSGVESTDANTKETSFGNLTTPFGGAASGNSSTGSTLFNGTSAAIANTVSSFFGGSSAALTSSTSSIFSGTSPATTTGSNLFNFNAGATTSAATNQPQAAGEGFSTATQSMPNQLGSSAASSPFVLTGNMAFSSGSSLFSPSASTSKLFGSGATFGMTSGTAAEANTVSFSTSPTTTTTMFVSAGQAPKSSGFGSTSSTGLGFGIPPVSNTANSNTPLVFGSSTSASSGSIFSFGLSAAASPSQPVFGNPNPITAFGSSPFGNNDQMNMEDSMAEDTVQATTPGMPVFGQQPITPPTSSYVFGSMTPSGGNQFGPAIPSGGNSFQFGSQPNVVASQNPSPFQASNSLESAGGSFSLGAGGGDKSNRKYVRVRKTQRKK